jgi:hypothetical protein
MCVSGAWRNWNGYKCVHSRGERRPSGSDKFQELAALRERGWEGLPPPPVFMINKPKPTGANQKDPAATPVATSLGLPNTDLESQIPRSPPLEPVATQSQTPRFPHLLPLILRPSASPLYPTSRSQMPLMTSLPSTPPSQILLRTNSPSTTPRPQSRTRPSISRKGMWKCCAETHCSVSTPASCPSTRLHFVGCSLGPAWMRQTHPTVALAFCPPTPPRISPFFSRPYTFPGKLTSRQADGWVR